MTHAEDSQKHNQPKVILKLFSKQKMKRRVCQEKTTTADISLFIRQ